MQMKCVVYDSGDNVIQVTARLLCDAFLKEGSKAYPYDTLWGTTNLLHEADAFMFGSRCSFGTVNADFRRLMEATEELWNQQPWRNKFSAGFTLSVCNSMYKLNTLQTLNGSPPIMECIG